VPAAILFDLRLGDSRIRPDAEAGYKACLAAQSGPVAEGSVGAGSGATIGKMQPGLPMKGGIGTASLRAGDRVVVSAIVAVNCVGNVADPKTGQIIAGSRSPRGTGFIDVMEWAGAGLPPEGGNTTIGVIATNASLNKAQAKKVAQMGHDGMARVINPVHTPWDGDTLFAISTSSVQTTIDLGRIGALAAEVVSKAILRAIRQAKSISDYPDYPSWQDVQTRSTL
jgi:L-aminopeptidase/D-esterase-like protein